MPNRRRLRLDDFAEGLSSLDLYRYEQTEETDTDRRRLSAMLSRIMDGELSERQRECVRLYFFEDRNITEISDNLGLSKAVVSRHIKKACKTMQRLAAYAFPSLKE